MRFAALAMASLCAFAAWPEQPAYQHGISLLHELKYPADFEHFDYANPDAPKGGRVVLSATAPIHNFSGVRGGQVPNAMGLGRTLDRLLIRSADELSGLYGQLVDGVALSADRRRLFLRLHADARWHDGVPVTTNDMLFSYRELLAMVFGKVYLEPWIESLEIVNDRELAVHHRQAFTNANLVALTWFPVRPAHYYAARDPREDTLVPPVGSGPYRIADFDGDYVVYRRVHDYWGPRTPDLPRLDCRRRKSWRCWNRIATVCRTGYSKSRCDFPERATIARPSNGLAACWPKRAGRCSAACWSTPREAASCWSC